MRDPATSTRPSIASRVAGAIVGGGGAYAVLRLTDAWGLGHGAVLALAGGMALAGLVLGPIVWRAVIDLF